jgi:predicted RNase H-like HicB family nuclease
MTQIEKLYAQLLANRGSIRFRDFQRIVEAFGFTLEGQRQSSRLSAPRCLASAQHPAARQSGKALPSRPVSPYCGGVRIEDRQVMDQHYHINVFWSQPDECWVADVPDLKSCSAFGDTPEEAIAEARLAIEGWLEVAREHGMPIPEARYRPAIYAAR